MDFYTTNMFASTSVIIVDSIWDNHNKISVNMFTKKDGTWACIYLAILICCDLYIT